MFPYEEVYPEYDCCPCCGDLSHSCDCDTVDEPYELTDVEADADTLRSAGYGTDEDYGGYGFDE